MGIFPVATELTGESCFIELRDKWKPLQRLLPAKWFRPTMTSLHHLKHSAIFNLDVTQTLQVAFFFCGVIEQTPCANFIMIKESLKIHVTLVFQSRGNRAWRHTRNAKVVFYALDGISRRIFIVWCHAISVNHKNKPILCFRVQWPLRTQHTNVFWFYAVGLIVMLPSGKTMLWTTKIFFVVLNDVTKC